MDTAEFMKLVRREKAWDVAPLLSLFGGYVLMVFLFTLFVGATMTINFMLASLLVGLYSFCNPILARGFLEWWKARAFGFHFTLIILELIALIVFSKTMVWLSASNIKNNENTI